MQFLFQRCILLLVFLGLGAISLGDALAQAADKASSGDESAEGTQAASVMAGMGIMVGEVTTDTALAQVRLTSTDKLVDADVPGAAGIVEFTISRDGADATQPVARQRVQAAPRRDFIARTKFTDLEPATLYRCTTRIGSDANSLREGPSARFKTLAGPHGSDPVRFVVVTGMNYAKFHGDNRIDRKIHLEQNNTELPNAYAGPDKQLGYPGLASIRERKPDFFVGTGDNVYYDTPTSPRAQTIPQMRRKWHEQFVQSRFRGLFADVPTYWEIDDHDYRVDDCDNSGDYRPLPDDGRRIMLEQLPFAAAGDDQAKTYRTHRVSRDLQIWLTEHRLHRSPNKMPDGPDKTIWGTEQKEWLKRTLAESDATYKILISPNPMIGPDDARKSDNHTNIGGFQHERDEFFAWLRNSGVADRNFYIICGDRHWQYHAIHPAGIEEFSCGALVDANSRLGRKPGDPKSTDPDALIRQPYSQNPRSGGFLLVTVTPGEQDRPATLAFDFCDEHGELLYRHVK